MDSIMIHGHQSLEALEKFAPKSGTLHKVKDMDGLILVHGNSLYEIPFMHVMGQQPVHAESSGEDSNEDEDNTGDGTTGDDNDDSTAGEGSNSNDAKTSASASASASTELPLTRKASASKSSK